MTLHHAEIRAGSPTSSVVLLVNNSTEEGGSSMKYNVKCIERTTYREELIEADSEKEAEEKCHSMLLSKELEIKDSNTEYETEDVTETEFEMVLTYTEIYEPVMVMAEDEEAAEEKCRALLDAGKLEIATTVISADVV
jgi:hypothetical protein